MGDVAITMMRSLKVKKMEFESVPSSIIMPVLHENIAYIDFS